MKTVSILGACGLALLALVACGGDAGSSPTAGASAAPGGSAKPEAATSAKPEAPKGKSVTAKFCLGPDGTSQDCGISCKVDKDPETCARWAEMTKVTCGKITKARCQEICDKDENPTACELAKAMK